jgi:hypothetical protein
MSSLALAQSSSPSGNSATSRQQTPIPCASITKLRDLAKNPGLTYFTNPRTGDQLDYIVIGDAAVSNEVLVMFNGTSAILPDWPEQVFTNSRWSPLIVNNGNYDPGEDGGISICHDYRIVFFDYPGTGLNPLAATFTGDQVANDVDAMLDDVAARYGISTAVVDPCGWSLGTNLALKYAFLSPISNPARVIHDVVLIATRPGGNTDGFQSGNQAECITTILDAVQQVYPTSKISGALQEDGIKLIFPYVDQPPYSGLNNVCTATVNPVQGTVDLNVTLNCSLLNHCDQTLEDDILNRKTEPWSKTDGIPHNLFLQERAFDNDYNICNCQAAAPNFTSTSCSCSASVLSSPRNGGMCQVTSSIPYAPVVKNCVPIQNTGRITVINGYEDLFVQWTYGKALVEGYQSQYGMQKAKLYTYDGDGKANHGVMYQHPLWTQEHISLALDEQ